MDVFRWDHNAHYHPLLLRELPSGCERVLDVGCGAGGLAGRLAAQAEHVDALDRSPAMIAIARSRLPADRVTSVLADVLEKPLPAAHYDAITSVSALHHMPLPQVLPRLAGALRPGGVLAATALCRTELPRELPLEVAAFVSSNAVGLIRSMRGLAHGVRPGRHDDDAVPPMMMPELTVREVRRQVQAALPDAQVRRLLYWRYLLVWHKPSG